MRKRLVFFVPWVLLGIPLGLIKSEWLGPAAQDADARPMLYAAAIIGGLGLLGLVSLMGYLASRPALQSMAGVKRSYWLLLSPLAWILGISIGVFWRYI